MTNTMPIDVVYMWCDGSDPKFIEEKKKRQTQLGLQWNENNLGSIRFFDNNELKYSLRSVSKYLPWVNHIYIVTNKQKPVWLKDHQNLTVVDHTDIIPKELLPTFNSVTIEMYLHRIPGLSEHFLFFNDDMFINAPLAPTFFFDQGKPIVRMIKDHERWQFRSIEECAKALDDPNLSSHRKTLLRAWMLFCIKHGITDFYILAHTIDSFTKTSVCKVLENYPELLKINSRPFRTDDDIQRVIFQMEMVKYFGFQFREIKPLTFAQKHLCNIFKQEVESFEGTESPKTWKRIRNLKPKMFCLNSAVKATKDVKNKSLHLLEELFPESSPYEK